MPSPTQITVSQLSRLIGLPDAPIIIDVCTDDDYELDKRLIPTAIRHPFKNIAALAPIFNRTTGHHCLQKRPQAGPRLRRCS